MKGYTIQNSINKLEEKVEKLKGSGGASTAANVSYDNSTSHLTADDVQEAIDEVVGSVSSLSGSINTISGALVTPFIDTTNVITAKTAITTTVTFTPTVDCFVQYILSGLNTKSDLSLDNVEVVCMWSTAQFTIEGIVAVKAGTEVTINSPTTGSYYTVYGMLPAIPTPPTNNTRSKRK